MKMLASFTRTAALLTALALAGGAEASVCRGEAPADGAEIRGPVLHVPDGERICVALGPDPAHWVELRVAPVGAAEWPDLRRGALMAASFGQDVTCRVVGETADGPFGVCRTAKGEMTRLLATPRIHKAAQAWR